MKKKDKDFIYREFDKRFWGIQSHNANLNIDSPNKKRGSGDEK